MISRTFRLPLPVDLRLTYRPLWYGHGDGTLRLAADHLVRAVRTPEGPATIELSVTAAQAEARAWGEGADWVLAQAPAMAGVHDDLTGFEPHDRPVARAARRLPALRIVATGTVADVLVPTILAQKVTGLEAARSWLGMCRVWGEPAPGPHDLRLPPAPAAMAGQPYWAYHRFGVERKRAEIILRACSRIDRLEEAAGMASADDAFRRLTALPGLGPWTAGIVMRWARGDADAVEIGDFHIPNHVCWNLAGEPRGDDTRMLELLEPYAGHRGRVVRLLLAGAQGAPKWGPRTAPRDLRRLTPPRR